jgi:hypothetical protein
MVRFCLKNKTEESQMLASMMMSYKDSPNEMSADVNESGSLIMTEVSESETQ